MIPRDAAISRCLEEARRIEAAVFVGNGNNARAVAALDDAPGVFYMLGSMGLCASIAVGYAKAKGIPTLAIEGDGNALMGSSMMSAVARCAPPRFGHIVLDNGLYESTGGQRTLADTVDFASLALANSYEDATVAATLDRLRSAIHTALSGGGPMLIHVPTAPAAAAKYPRVPLSPQQIRTRFQGWSADAIGGA